MTGTPGLHVGPQSDLASLLARPRRPLLAVWMLMAAVNLSAGIMIATWPERQADLDTMRRWGGQWLASGTNVYVSDEDAPDYPPHALVALSPLGILPAEWAVPVWAAVNLSLALLAPWLVVRAVSPTATWSTAALPVAMFLCWGGFRTLLQFGLLTLSLGLLAMVLADTRPRWSGVCLGLSLMKPQIALPFVLWALFTRRMRVLTVAGIVVVAGFAVFCLRARAEPVTLVLHYAAILRMFYMGDAIMVGLSQLRPLIGHAVADVATADAIAVAIALLMLAAICAIAYREGRRPAAPMYGAPALVAIWSLLTFYHLTYGYLLLLPAAALLIYTDDPRTAAFRMRVFWSLQVLLMVDVPGAWRRVGAVVAPPDAPLSVAVRHFDRVAILALFACFMSLALTARRNRGGTGERPDSGQAGA